MNSKKNFIQDRPNKVFIFPKKNQGNELKPLMAGVLNVSGVVLEVALWDNKAKSGMTFYGGTVKDSANNKHRIALFSAAKKSEKSPSYFGKFYYDGVFYKMFLWQKTSDKCPVYYSGIVKVDLTLKKN